MYKFLMKFKSGRSFVARQLAKSEDPVENLTAMYLRGELEVIRNSGYELVLPNGSKIKVDRRGRRGRGRERKVVIDGGMGEDGFVVSCWEGDDSPITFFWKVLNGDYTAEANRKAGLEEASRLQAEKDAMRKMIRG